jgi:mannose-6-phosphate isomerase-like protein (cupin superfamily)
MVEEDDALREAAKHRGFRLVKSRRRKPGGDFGKFALVDAGGAEVFGYGADGLTASADEIAAFLRDSAAATWKQSAGSVRKRKPAPVEKPKPAPKPKLEKLAVGNLFAKLPAAKRGEVTTELLARPGVRVERIVSQGQATPDDTPYRQERDEWVVVLAGAARLRLDGAEEVALGIGDHLTIPAGRRHWVTWTNPDEPTVWLAIHVRS